MEAKKDMSDELFDEDAMIDEGEWSNCQRPCHPDSGCPECAGYWLEMIAQGFWDADHKYWTDKGLQEMTKF